MTGGGGRGATLVRPGDRDVVPPAAAGPPRATTERRWDRVPRWAALSAILVLAAALRFSGLSWGLRHTPHWDERVFVENAVQMVAAGDLDHRYYEYPGLFFYLLYPVLAAGGLASPANPAAYLTVRGVVAGFGVAAVGAAYVLGRRLAGSAGGLAGALLLAASPLDVRTAHEVRPDVVLQFFVLLAFLGFSRVGSRTTGDLLAGFLIGAATAVKFTGALLVPSYLSRRLVTPGPRGRGAAVAAAAAAAALVAFTPYGLLHSDAYLSGLEIQWSAHYHTGDALGPRLLKRLGFYAGAAAANLGLPGSLLLAAGTWTCVHRWRTWGPLLLHPLATLAVLSTADVQFARHLVPAMGVLAVVAGSGAVALARGRPAAVAAIAALAAAGPLARSGSFARGLSRPSTWDRVVDWLGANASEGSRILTAEPGMGLDRARYEVLEATGVPVIDCLLAGEADLVVTGPGRVEVGGMRPLFTATPERPEAGPTAAVHSVPDSIRPAYRRVNLETARLTASENPEAIDAVRDADERTAWSTGRPQQPGQWVQVELPEPILLGRVELVLGNRPQRQGRVLRLWVSANGGSWSVVRTVPGRPALHEQVGGPASDVLLFEPVPARRLRLVQEGSARRRWGFAELRLDARSLAPP